MGTYAIFFPHTFPAHFVGFLFFVFFPAFFCFLYYFMKMKAYTVCAAELRHLFLRFSGHSVKEIGKLLKNSEGYK